MRSKPRTAAEKAWHEVVAEFAETSVWLEAMYSGIVKDPYNFQIDHIIGAQAKRKVNGVSVKVGEWAVMPIPAELHDISSNHRLNRTLQPAAYRAAFGHEKYIWQRFHESIKREMGTPITPEMVEAILR